MSDKRPPLIDLADIHKSYGGGEGTPRVKVLHGISLSIHAGEFVALVGASGSGKSTLMHILGCLDRPSSGTYRFAGRDISAFSADELAWLRRETFGFVFQGYHLIRALDACHNVQVPAVYAGTPPAIRTERAAALLARLGLGERAGQRPGQLSGGQQQRVSIARALMNGGNVILADEPTGALDSQSGAEVMALLKELGGAYRHPDYPRPESRRAGPSRHPDQRRARRRHGNSGKHWGRTSSLRGAQRRGNP